MWLRPNFAEGFFVLASSRNGQDNALPTYETFQHAAPVMQGDPHCSVLPQILRVHSVSGTDQAMPYAEQQSSFVCGEVLNYVVIVLVEPRFRQRLSARSLNIQEEISGQILLPLSPWIPERWRSLAWLRFCERSWRPALRLDDEQYR